MEKYGGLLKPGNKTEVIVPGVKKLREEREGKGLMGDYKVISMKKTGLSITALGMNREAD
jgi:hypothetical protein